MALANLLNTLRQINIFLNSEDLVVDGRIKEKLLKYAFSNRVPLFATIELTGNCNFRCLHCYIPEDARNSYMEYDDFKQIVDQLINRGCLYVTLTGGEVFMHPRFIDMYLYLIKRGISVQVFTNGSLISDKIINLFEKYKPRNIEITMYGYSECTYKLVTGVSAFEKTKVAILKLLERNIHVTLKAFILKENMGDLDELIRFAKSKKLPFKSSALIIAPKHSSALNHQIPYDMLSSIEQKITYKKQTDNSWYEWNDLVRRTTETRLFNCGAGRISCWIKSDCKLRLCNFLDEIQADLKTDTFDNCWNFLRKYIELDFPTQSPCSICDNRNKCSICPAKAKVLGDDMYMLNPQNYFCDLTKQLLEER